MHKDEAVRFEAEYTGSLLKIPAALPALQKFCFAETPFLRMALGLLYHVINESDISEAVTQIHRSSFPRALKHTALPWQAWQIKSRFYLNG